MAMELREALGYFRGKVARNWRWGRTHGWANLLEEHDLDPRVRLPRAARDLRWSLEHLGATDPARPVFLVGAQRSGTNMMAHGLDQAPEFKVYNEGNGRAFHRYQLRDLSTIDGLVARSRRPFVLFKPLCDSDRTAELLDRARAGLPGRAIWAFRDVEGRVRSQVMKFGSADLEALRVFADGTHTTHWQVRGLSAESAALVRSLDVHRMTPHTGSALFWYLRNLQYFERGLDQRDDVVLADYGAFLTDPEGAMRSLCSFIGFPYRPQLVAHIQPQQRTPRTAVEIDGRVRDLCADLYERLCATYAGQRKALLSSRDRPSSGRPAQGPPADGTPAVPRTPPGAGRSPAGGA